MQRRSLSWVALVGVGLASVVAVSAAAALAARSAASPLELVFNGRYEPSRVASEPWGHLVGTFTSGAPFCESGTAVGLGRQRLEEMSGATRAAMAAAA